MPPKKKAKKDPSLEKYEEELRSLADEQLRRALMDIGENPGPIDSSNRWHTYIHTSIYYLHT